ncbi:MAG: arylsulfatase [Akkermansiaceae bacterium]
MVRAVVFVAAAAISSLYAASQPNIILVMPDDVGSGDYACMGNPVIKTPSVDGFRQQSVLFNRFHVSPTCAPTRSALMSGRHEFKNGVTHTIFERERMSLKTFTLPHLLKSVGYTNGIFGKWHLGDEAEYRPESRGFDEVYIHGGGGIGQTYVGSCGDAPGNTNINPALWHNGKFVKTNGYCTDLFFDQALRWIDAKRSEKKPFFAYITLNAAHSPLVLPESYYQQYLGKPGVTADMAKFFGMIENIDQNFGKLLGKVREWGLEQDTLVIYIGGDNGGTVGTPLFNAGLRGTKGTSYQGGTRTICMMRWPAGGVASKITSHPAAGIGSSALCSALTAHIDLYPTLAEITGATLPDSAKSQVEGRSMWPLMQNPGADWADRTLVHHVGRWERSESEKGKFRNMAIQNTRYTLVNNRELYDLQTDPGEKNNVIDEHPEVVSQLRSTYETWWQEVQPLLVNENLDGPAQNPLKVLYWKQFGGGPGPGEKDPSQKNKGPKRKKTMQ